MNQFRTLFSKEELGILQIQSLRQKASEQYENADSIAVYKQKIGDDFSELRLDVKRDEIKNFILLMDCTPEEISTLKALLLDYQNVYNNTVHHVKQFVFGTQIMRICYICNKPDVALNVIYSTIIKNNCIENRFNEIPFKFSVIP